MTTPSKTTSNFGKMAILGFLLLLCILAYVVVNERIESGQLTGAETSYVDMSTCKLEELDENRISLTIPGEFAADATQAELNESAEEMGYESMTLNENGTITYVITKEQHKEMLDHLRIGIGQTLEAMVGSKNYKGIAAVTYNDDFSYIKVDISTTTPSYDNSLSLLQFKLYNNLYNAFQGTPNAPLLVEYYNKDGKLIATYNSLTDTDTGTEAE